VRFREIEPETMSPELFDVISGYEALSKKKTLARGVDDYRSDIRNKPLTLDWVLLIKRVCSATITLSGSAKVVDAGHELMVPLKFVLQKVQ